MKRKVPASLQQQRRFDCEHCQDKICKHRDGEWIRRCPEAQAWDDETSARWQQEREHPCVATICRYNGRLVSNNEDLR